MPRDGAIVFGDLESAKKEPRCSWALGGRASCYSATVAFGDYAAAIDANAMGN